MEESLYSASQGDAFGPLTSTRISRYAETTYHNSTTLNLAIIEFDGTITQLPPECNSNLFGKQQVSITRRGMTGQTTHADNKAILMPGNIITIPVESLLNNYQVYVKELNVVICLADHAHLIKHPYACVDYAKALNDLREDLLDVADKSPTVMFTVNDPYNKLQQDIVYGIMYGEILEIPVTKHLEKTGELSLFSTITANGTVFTYSESLEAMVSEKEPVDLVEFHNSLLLAITTTRREAQRYRREQSRITEKDLNDREKRIRAEIEESYRLQITQLKSDGERLKIKLEAAEAERDRFKDQYNTLIADHRTQADLDDISAKRRISNNNVDISENKKKESEIKLKHVIIAAAVPTAVAVVCKVIELIIKSKASK